MDLVKEMLDYSKKKRAEVVYKKCVKAGKLKLASKIDYLYNLKMTFQDDNLLAFRYAIMAQNRNGLFRVVNN